MTAKLLEFSNKYHRARPGDRVNPGDPIAIPNSASVGDGGSQGDLIIRVEKYGYVPQGFRIVENPTDEDRQLMPGNSNTTGSKHCLASLDTCVLFWPPGWTHDQSYNKYSGPVLHCSDDTTITHPTHGDVTIPGGMCVSLHYQRVYDEELKRERRQLD